MNEVITGVSCFILGAFVWALVRRRLDRRCPKPNCMMPTMCPVHDVPVIRAIWVKRGILGRVAAEQAKASR